MAPSLTRRHSVSSAPSCIAFQRVEARTGRFSEGIFVKSEDVYLNGSTAFMRSLRHTVACRKIHCLQESQDDSRNLINIATDFTHRQHIVKRVGAHPNQERPLGKDC